MGRGVTLPFTTRFLCAFCSINTSTVLSYRTFLPYPSFAAPDASAQGATCSSCSSCSRFVRFGGRAERGAAREQELPMRNQGQEGGQGEGV